MYTLHVCALKPTSVHTMYVLAYNQECICSVCFHLKAKNESQRLRQRCVMALATSIIAPDGPAVTNK